LFEFSSRFLPSCRLASDLRDPLSLSLSLGGFSSIFHSRALDARLVPCNKRHSMPENWSYLWTLKSWQTLFSPHTACSLRRSKTNNPESKQRGYSCDIDWSHAFLKDDGDVIGMILEIVGMARCCLIIRIREIIATVEVSSCHKLNIKNKKNTVCSIKGQMHQRASHAHWQNRAGQPLSCLG